MSKPLYRSKEELDKLFKESYEKNRRLNEIPKLGCGLAILFFSSLLTLIITTGNLF